MKNHPVKATRLFRVVVRLSNGYRRLLATIIGILGPDLAYRITGGLARVAYWGLPAIRQRSEAQCKAALIARVSANRIPLIAQHAFIHRVWNLTDLMLADRYLHVGTFEQYGGRVTASYLNILLEAQRLRHPVILLTAYYGPFDLLPVFLGYNGIRAGVVYRPHENLAFDAYRKRIRGRSGCEMIPLQRAAIRLAEILESGGMIAIVADHQAERRGVETTFLGLPTMALRSVALLAQQYRASIAVAGIRRLDHRFRFELPVCDIFGQQDWESTADPTRYITERYLRGLEQLILGDPSQYLWAHQRWHKAALTELPADRKPDSGSVTD